jgi:hypothetical protein
MIVGDDSLSKIKPRNLGTGVQTRRNEEREENQIKISSKLPFVLFVSSWFIPIFAVLI